MPFFKMIFSWWNSATWGTWLMTKFRGEPVGTPEPGGNELDWFFSNLAAGHDTLPDRISSEFVN